MKKYFLLILLALVSCGGVPDDVKPVNDFKIERYLGVWYEIARFDHSFEKGLQRVTANYTLRPDGGVKVINRGFLAEKSKWKESEGKAFFADGDDKGYLKVSFFGPFYASYVIFYLDENYQYSLVTGHNKSYFWILSRTPHIDDATRAMLVGKATALGFNMEKLIYVDQQ
jgi:apolipoprotein D and lipocalin family protein